MKARCFVLLCCALVAVALPGGGRAQGQPVCGFVVETGVSDTMWTENLQQLAGYGWQQVTGRRRLALPFAVGLMNRCYDSVDVTMGGALVFGDEEVAVGDEVLFGPGGATLPEGVAALLPHHYDAEGMVVQMAVAGRAPHRVAVVQLTYGTGGLGVQVRMCEGEAALTMVYRGTQAVVARGVAPGAVVWGGCRLLIDPQTHGAVAAGGSVYVQPSWPGHGRYYVLTPTDSLCAPVGGVVAVPSVAADEVLLRWDCSGAAARSFAVEWGEASTPPEQWDRALVEGEGQLLLQGLEPQTAYAARVYNTACEGLEPVEVEFVTPCVKEGSVLNYAALGGVGVTCGTGVYEEPSVLPPASTVVDRGSQNGSSRHTVHSSTAETDSRTGGRLHTVPQGFCNSVRLGNWQSGRQQESVAYELRVDTARFDLLILRYALVEQNPNHPESQQPKFELMFLDSTGNLIGACYHGNFISGDLSGWQQGNPGVVWRDWQAVGLDVAPLHGQRVYVVLSNYDCSLGMHFGYAYFTLESGTKHIMAQNCGNGTENSFTAPDGFGYRWYAAADTATTLSTERTLHVTDTGVYGCRVTYQLGEHVCGFTVKTYAGGRFPVAAFGVERLDSCGARCRLVNRSVIARDEGRTRLTTFPCEEYLWRFDDGTTSTQVNPVHRFDEGVHPVTLYAMLAGGECVDSLTDTVVVRVEHDTLREAICEGETFLFHGQRLGETGVYEWASDCRTERLELTVNPVYGVLVEDVFELGEGYRFADTLVFDRPGVYDVGLVSAQGCDSVVRLWLSCHERHDTVVCETGMPTVWRGTTWNVGGRNVAVHRSVGGPDSTVDLTLVVRRRVRTAVEPQVWCDPPGGWLLRLPDTLRAAWNWTPQGETAPVQADSAEAGAWRLSPADSAVYFLTLDYRDEPSCPLHDTLALPAVDYIEAAMVFRPRRVVADSADLLAEDRSAGRHRSVWFVDGLLYAEGMEEIVFRPDWEADSVGLMLVAEGRFCADTVRATVPVAFQSLWFPNVFTPVEGQNNLFRGYGHGVENYDLKVYTRWGDCIFHTRRMEEGWNGTYRGVESPEGAYAYICHYTSAEGEACVATGTVTLLR